MTPARNAPPAVSILMATHNQGQFIRQALDSVFRQSIPAKSFEVIVINDGSTDDTTQILADYSTMARIISRENRGLVESCNEGLSVARGRYFARIDSDDYVDENWLSSLLEALNRHTDACCAVPDMYELRGTATTYVKLNPDNIYTLQACGTMFRTDQLRAAGGFRPFYWEEFDLYLRLRAFGPFIHVPQPLYIYRKHPGGMTHDFSRRLEGWAELAKSWGYDHLKSVGVHEDLDKASAMFETKES
jgi:glycosyltransferase involved in cell wall biosynthesis